MTFGPNIKGLYYTQYPHVSVGHFGITSGSRRDDEQVVVIDKKIIFLIIDSGPTRILDAIFLQKKFELCNKVKSPEKD